MQRNAKIFLSCYFIVYALLYLTDGYTSFEMHPIILTGAGVILIVITIVMINGHILQSGLFTSSIIIFSLFIMLTSFI